MEFKVFSNALLKLRSVEQKLMKEFEKTTGFSLTRYEILIFLKNKGDSLQSEIIDYIKIDPAAITRHLKILEDKGYVKRRRNVENTREVIVSLTEFSIKELEKCQVKQTETTCELLFPFSQLDIEKLMEVLIEIEKKL